MSNHQQKWSWKKIMKQIIYNIFFQWIPNRVNSKCPVSSESLFLSLLIILPQEQEFWGTELHELRIGKGEHQMVESVHGPWWKIIVLHQRRCYCLCSWFLIMWYRGQISVQMKAAPINQWIKILKIIRFNLFVFLSKFVITSSILWCEPNFFNGQTE